MRNFGIRTTKQYKTLWFSCNNPTDCAKWQFVAKPLFSLPFIAHHVNHKTISQFFSDKVLPFSAASFHACLIAILVPRAFSLPRPPSEGGRGREKALGMRMIACLAHCACLPHCLPASLPACLPHCLPACLVGMFSLIQQICGLQEK